MVDNIVIRISKYFVSGYLILLNSHKIMVGNHTKYTKYKNVYLMSFWSTKTQANAWQVLYTVFTS